MRSFTSSTLANLSPRQPRHFLSLPAPLPSAPIDFVDGSSVQKVASSRTTPLCRFCAPIHRQDSRYGIQSFSLYALAKSRRHRMPTPAPHVPISGFRERKPPTPRSQRPLLRAAAPPCSCTGSAQGLMAPWSINMGEEEQKATACRLPVTQRTPSPGWLRNSMCARSTAAVREA